MIKTKKYTTIADLLTDDGFLAWHLKKDAVHEMAWDNWMAEKYEHAELAAKAVQVLNVFISLKKENLSSYQVNTSFDRLLKKMGKMKLNVTNVEV